MNRDRISYLLTFLGVALLSLGSIGVGQSIAQDEIPDTPAGMRLAGLLEALDKQGETMDAFFLNAFEDQNEEAVTHRRAQSEMVLSELGAFQFDKLVGSSDHEISARCKTANGPIAVLSLTVSDEAPHQITGISLEISDGDEEAEEDNSPLSAEEKVATVERLIDELNSKYVFPEVAEKMAADLRKSLDENAYEDVTEPSIFAGRLTDQLREICKDKHLRVMAGPMRRPSSTQGRRPVDNHGFVKAEMLAGGIGYLKFNYFSGEKDAEKTAAAAMNFLANSQAIIFDVRENGGGSPEMIAFLSGYLFDESIHLNSFYNRPTDTTTESWSRDDVPGDRFGNKKPVYVLTSDYSFSGAEEFSYNLKHLKRATLVGETTGGGAHPVRPVRLGNRFGMSMPFARAINPITETNWEGVGVVPHVKVDSDEALDKAIELAKKAIEEAEVTEQAPSTDELIGNAMEAMQAGEFAEAAGALQQLVEQRPGDGQAWFNLGYCLHMDGKLDEAIVAHKKAIELKANESTATYNLACAYSLKNDSEKAISTLKLAIEKGMRDYNQVANDSDFDNVRETPEFKELLETIK